MRFAFSCAAGFVTTLALFLGSASAQSPYRREVFASIGVVEGVATAFNSGENDVNIGGGFGFRPFSKDRSRWLRMLGGEFEVNTTPTSGDTLTYFTASVLAHASVAGAEPYFLIGMGGAHGDGAFGRAETVAVGVKFFITEHVSVRPEFRLQATPHSLNGARGSAAVGYHW